jgi:hypothetical protein
VARDGQLIFPSLLRLAAAARFAVGKQITKLRKPLVRTHQCCDVPGQRDAIAMLAPETPRHASKRHRNFPGRQMPYGLRIETRFREAGDQL